MRYCIWNNKGGVGKTFLTYCLAVEYAIRHPKKSVAVVDMCPQANVSEVLLGGNGTGETNLSKCYDQGRTIAGYIKSRYDKSRFGKMGVESTYFVPVTNHNHAMPSNLYLLPGDSDLDICAAIIDYMAIAPERGAWGKSRKFLFDLVETFEQEHRDTTVFIDANPSFANYTQLAMLAAHRLIIPCTADSASIRGMCNVFRLLFGVKIGQNISEDPVFDEFSSKIKDIGAIPSVHAIVLNKSRTMDRIASVAYVSHAEEIEKITQGLVNSHRNLFTPSGDNRVFNLKDCNTIAPVLNHTGIPPSDLKQGSYTVYNRSTRVNTSQITPFLEHLQTIVSELE
jgi:cellulose biosynthesis protein BcsQ